MERDMWRRNSPKQTKSPLSKYCLDTEIIEMM